MRVLQREHPSRGRSHVAYLSSHPDTVDRIAEADEAATRFAATHPDLCPQGVCPDEDADDESECEDCDDDSDQSPSNLSCNKD